MNKIVVSDNINIENMIYEIRGKQVMLDSDLARLYGCKNGTKSLNLAVKRHINRFPERFMFQLTKEEYSSIYSRFQFETLNKNNQKQGLNIKYLPYVFTEQGVAMLSAILKTDVAEEISIKIMDAFVAMKKIINTSLIEQKYFNELTIKNTKDIKLLQESFDKLNTKESNNHIFYEGQIYDVDIMNVVFMLAIHELGEAIIDDLTQFEINENDKEKIEHAAVHEILSGILDGKQIEELFLEFDSHSTKEAFFAYQCDKLECDLQSKIYDEEGCVDLTKQDGNFVMNNSIVKRLLDNGESWSTMWLKYGQEMYPYDDNFKAVSNYAIKNKIKK